LNRKQLTHTFRILTTNQNDPFSVIYHATARTRHGVLEKHWRTKLWTRTIGALALLL